MSELDFIESYKDILRLIESHQKIIDLQQEEINFNLKQMHSTAPHGISAVCLDGQPSGNLSPWTLDRCLDNIRRAEHIIELEQAHTDRLEAKKQEIEGTLNELEGLYLKVAVKRDIEGLTYKEIAEDLGYTEQYIRLVYSLTRKKFSGYEKDSTNIQQTD